MAKRSENTASGAPSDAAITSRSSRSDKRDEARPLAKSMDPAYMKFTTYIRKTTHLSVKTRLVSKQMEFSDLVEELLTNWLKENESILTSR